MPIRVYKKVNRLNHLPDATILYRLDDKEMFDVLQEHFTKQLEELKEFKHFVVSTEVKIECFKTKPKNDG